MMMNREACHHLLVFFLGAKDNNELEGSSLSFDFFLRCKNDDEPRSRLVVVFYFF
jgi:hypothetical protein